MTEELEVKPIIFRHISGNNGGGAERYCNNLNKYLQENGKYVVTFIPKSELNHPEEHPQANGLRYIHDCRIKTMYSYIKSNKNRVRYLHSHLRKASIICSVLSLIFKIPHIITVHGALYKENKSIKDRLILALFKEIVKRSALVIFNSEFTKNLVLDQLRISGRNIRSKVIYNGSVDSEQSIFNTVLEDSGPIKVCVVGALTRQKGMEDLLWLSQELKRRSYDNLIEIHIYGRGIFKKQIVKESEENVVLQYHDFENNVDKIFSSNHLHLILSTNEGFGRVVTEAMARRRPTLAKKSGAFSELIEEGVNGWLTSNDREEILQKLIFLANNRHEIHNAGLRSRIIYEKYFTNEIFARKTSEEIEIALGEL